MYLLAIFISKKEPNGLAVLNVYVGFWVGLLFLAL